MTIWELIKTQVSAASSTFEYLAAFVVSLIIFFAVMKSGFSITKILIGVLGGALAFWGIVGNGMEVLSTLFSNTFGSLGQ